MTAVAVWDHLPSLDELLDARLARGWEPKRSTVADNAVLGYAACRWSPAQPETP
ncbi:MAG: hypothetical protein IPI35_30355 [Deltaproteobacteria bacterium]|nr:hypothetical protein [Deltaproteobacteria bacterium]